MDDAPADPGRADNLFDTPPGTQGARGRFDDRAKDSSLQLWMTMHRGVVLLTVTALLLVMVALLLVLLG
jgi:hypothetical protein